LLLGLFQFPPFANDSIQKWNGYAEQLFGAVATTSSSSSSSSTAAAKSTNEPQKFAFVHLLTNAGPDYLIALLTSAHRLVSLHQHTNQTTAPEFPHQLDLVVMLPTTKSSQVESYSHPYIRYVFYDPSPIENALEGKHYWLDTMHKLAPLSLKEYDAIFFLDLDVLVVQSLASVFLEFKAPAMVYWGIYPKYTFNSGCQLMKPSQAIYNDAIMILQQNGHRDKTATEIAKYANKDFLSSHKHELPPAAPIGNYRGDQEFLHSFYNIIPGTSHKHGPIHPLPYGYCARSATLESTTQELLEGNVKDEASLAEGGLLHLYGGFGHDGQGHSIHETRNEQGINNLFAVHFTVDKPWKKNVDVSKLDSHSRVNATMTPQERCPMEFFHIEYWVSAIEALATAAHSNKYGDGWTSKTMLALVDSISVIKACMEPEAKELKIALAQTRPKLGNTGRLAGYKPLIAARIGT
jgi:hypothetical protein